MSNYNNIKEIENVKELKKVLKTSGIEEYDAYVGYCDSLYGITEVFEEMDDTLYVQSEETYGEGSQMNCEELLSAINSNCEDNDLCITALPAENIDPELDMQLEDETEIYGVAIDDTNEMVVLLAR